MRRLIAGFLAGISVSLCYAQDEQVVVTAARLPQPRSQTLQPVNVITAEDIAQTGQQTLVEVLQALGGVEIISNGGFGQPSGVFIRGANTGHTLVLVDGMRIGSATVGATALEHIPLNQIERIEIVPGQLSSLYGSDAIGGVVQIFTKTGAEAPAASATAGVGTYDTRTIAGGVRRSFGDTTVSVNAGEFETAGFDATKPSIPFGLHNPDRDGYRNTNLSAALAHRVAAGHELGVSLFQSDGKTHFDNGPATDDVNHETLTAYSLYSRNQVTSAWQSLVRIGEATDDQKISGAFPGFFTTRQPQLSWQNNVSVGPGTAIAGVEYLGQHVASDTAYTRTYRNIRSAFVGYLGQLGPHAWQVNVRQDDNSQFGNHATGLLGYAYRLTPAWRIRASTSTAFRAPTFNDLYFPGFANPNLQPEKARSREAGVQYAAGANRFSATYFDNRITDLIVFDTTTFTPQNLDRARIKGTELAYDTSWRSFTVRARATLQDPVDEATGKRLPRRARQYGTLSLSHTRGPMQLGAEVVASGERFDTTDESPDSRMHGYGLLNLIASYRLSRTFTLQARWNNVFDREYELAQHFNTPGSNLFLSLRYEL